MSLCHRLVAMLPVCHRVTGVESRMDYHFLVYNTLAGYLLLPEVVSALRYDVVMLSDTSRALIGINVTSCHRLICYDIKFVVFDVQTQAFV